MTSERPTGGPRLLPATAEPGPLARHLHLVDAENLGVETRGGPVGPGTGRIYRLLTRPSVADQYLVGADATRAFDLSREFPGARHCLGRGPDGGELAVLQTVDPDLLVARFDALTIASGDWRFVQLARTAARRGLWVRVVSRRARLARVLAAAADEILEFPDPLGAAVAAPARTPSDQVA